MILCTITIRDSGRCVSNVTMGGDPVLLPEWLRGVWVAVYAIILIVHARHAVNMGGQRRAWHSGHTVMALGMAYMFLPTDLKAVPELAWETVFSALAAVIGGWVVVTWTRYGAVNLLWALSAIDMLAMVYRFALPWVGIAVVTYALVAYFVSEMVAWAFGSFDEADGRRRGLVAFTIGSRSPGAYTFTKPLVGTSSVELRATLGAMAAGMAYMFIAMTVGM